MRNPWRIRYRIPLWMNEESTHTLPILLYYCFPLSSKFHSKREGGARTTNHLEKTLSPLQLLILSLTNNISFGIQPGYFHNIYLFCCSYKKPQLQVILYSQNPQPNITINITLFDFISNPPSQFPLLFSKA